MIIAIAVLIVGIVVVVAVFQARASNKDSNGPMDNN
jgi:hypothetical protein